MKQLFIAKVFVSTLFLLSFFVWQVVHGTENLTPQAPSYVVQIETLLASTSADNDLLGAKLVIDKLIDPKIDTNAVRAQIESMAADIQNLLPKDAAEQDKVHALRTYLYEGGEWNNYKPFSYDLDDPQGDSRTSRLLYYYLKTRKGNCVSMPILQAILGQKIGLDMTISTAPFHMFIKYTDKQGSTINIEATSGGYPSRDKWYQQNLPMLPKAIKNGMFMKKLRPKEAIAAMGLDLTIHLTKAGHYAQAIQVSEKLIAVFPNFAPLYFSRGSAYSKLIDTEFKRKYPNLTDIPDALKPKFQTYLHQNMVSFKIAEELGWRDPDELAKERKRAVK